MRWLALLLLWPVLLLSLACEAGESTPTATATVAVTATDTPVAETPPAPPSQATSAPTPTVVPTAEGTVVPRKRAGLGFGHPPFCIEIGEVSICF
jgi:hypothetical protein